MPPKRRNGSSSKRSSPSSSHSSSSPSYQPTSLSSSLISDDSSISEVILHNSSRSVIYASKYRTALASVQYLQANYLKDHGFRHLKDKMELLHRHRDSCHIVHTYGGHFDKYNANETFMVMARCSMTLQKYLQLIFLAKKQRLPLQAVLIITRNVLRLIRYLRAHNLYQWDLNTQHLFISSSYDIQTAHVLSSITKPSNVLTPPEISLCTLQPQCEPIAVWAMGTLLAQCILGPHWSEGTTPLILLSEAREAIRVAQAFRSKKLDVRALICVRAGSLCEVRRRMHVLEPLLRGCWTLNTRKRWSLADVQQKVEGMIASPQESLSWNPEALLSSSSTSSSSSASPLLSRLNCHFTWGPAFWRPHLLSQARQNHRAWRAHWKDYPPAANLGAYFMALDGRTPDALRVSFQALESDPQDSVVRDCLAYLFLQQGEETKALRVYGDGGTDVFSLESHQGWCLTALGLPDRAADLLASSATRAAAWSPAYARGRETVFGAALRVIMDEGEAMPALLQPSYDAVEVLLCLGVAFMTTQDSPNAVLQFQAATARRPDAADLQEKLARVLCEMDRLEEAIPHAERACTLDPSQATYPGLLAHIHADLKDFPKAQRHAQRALELNGRLDTMHLILGKVCLTQGQFPRALTHFQREAEINPRSAPAHHFWATVLVMTCRPSEALGHYQRAVELDPEYFPAHAGWAQCLNLLGRESEAQTHLLQMGKLMQEHRDKAETHIAENKW